MTSPPCAPSVSKELLLRRLKGANELAADDLTLGPGSLTPASAAEETLRLVDGEHANAHASGVILLHLLTLARAQQAVIDEEAGELVTHGLVHHSAAATDESTPPESAQITCAPPTWARIFATLSSMMELDVHVGSKARRPRRGEVLQGLLAVLGVLDLGVPLQPKQLALAVLEGGHGCLGRLGGDGSHLRALPGRRRRGSSTPLVGGGAVESDRAASNCHLGAPILAGTGTADGAAKGLRHDLP